MIRLGRVQVSPEGLLALGLLVALSLGGVRCSAYRQGGDDARLVQLEANAHKASMAGIASRHRADSVTRLVTRNVAAVRTAGGRLDATLDTAEAVLANDSAGVPELRAALTAVTTEARVYRDSTEVLLDAVGSLLVAHDAERTANAAHVAAQRAVIAALKDRECRVLGLRCPSRRTAFAAGVVLTLAAVVAK